MEYRQLGSSSLQVSRIGFGCMSLPKDLSSAKEILLRAKDSGINFFDTADLYDKGENESILGSVFGKSKEGLVIATKVGNQWRADGSGWDWNPSPSYITKSVEDSLKRLRTDCIDLYQLHGGTMEDPIDETIGAFEQLVQQGKIRYYGISSIRPNVIREWAARSRMVSTMMQYSLLDKRPEETALPLLRQKRIGVLARGSVAQGLLAGKPPKAYLGHQVEEVRRAAAAVGEVAGKGSAAQAAIRWVMQEDAVTSIIIGIRTLEQLDEAAGAAALPPLTSGEVQLLRDSVPALHYTEHR